MWNHVENHKCYKNPFHPFRKFSFSELHREEYCHKCHNMSCVTTEPMRPIEQRPSFASWMWSEKCSYGLEEANQCCDCSKNCVRIVDLKLAQKIVILFFARSKLVVACIIHYRWPSSNFNPNYYKCGNCKSPSDKHKQSMPLKKDNCKKNCSMTEKMLEKKYWSWEKLTANQISLPHMLLPTHVCLKYLAAKIRNNECCWNEFNFKFKTRLFYVYSWTWERFTNLIKFQSMQYRSMQQS